MKKQTLYGMLGFLPAGVRRRVYGSAGIPGLLRLCGGLPVLLLKSDEMLEAQLARSASRAFVAGMLMMAAAVLGTLTLGGFTPSGHSLPAARLAGLPLWWSTP